MVSILLGGFTPVIASMLMAWTDGQVWSVALLLGGTSLVAALTLAISHETAPAVVGTTPSVSVAAQAVSTN